MTREEPRIVPERIKEITSATSRAELLHQLGVSTATNNYLQLESVAASHDLELPPKLNRGPSRKDIADFCTVEYLQRSIEKFDNITDILRDLGVNDNTTHRRYLKKIAVSANIILPRGRGGGGKIFRQAKRLQTIDRVLVKGTKKVHGGRLKTLMLSVGFELICAICGQGQEWNNLPLVLQVDHIDGNKTNNERNNLRFVCPNCHTQTDTFAGRNLKRK